MKEEEELGLRRVTGWSAYVVPTIALCWSLFQLSLSSWLLLDSTIIRAIHLAFRITSYNVCYTKLLRAVFENVDELRKLHPALEVLTRENMLQGLSAPLHPGAEKYLKEAGLIK